MTEKFVGTRDVPCPTCGEPAGSPCRLRSGKLLVDLHCTDRVTRAGGVEPMTPPSPPYSPGERSSAEPAQAPPEAPATPELTSGPKEGPAARTAPSPEPADTPAADVAAERSGPRPTKDHAPARRRQRKAVSQADPELMPALF